MPTGRPSVFRLPSALVVDTKVVAALRQPHVLSHYEITIAPDADPSAARTVLVTHDAAAYRTALDGEGTDRRFVVRWSPGKRPDGTRCSVLVGVEEVERVGL